MDCNDNVLSSKCQRTACNALSHSTSFDPPNCQKNCCLLQLALFPLSAPYVLAFIQVTQLNSLKLNCCCSKVPQNLVTIHPFLTYPSSIQVAGCFFQNN